jgi:hypothetical protein
LQYIKKDIKWEINFAAATIKMNFLREERFKRLQSNLLIRNKDLKEE